RRWRAFNGTPNRRRRAAVTPAQPAVRAAARLRSASSPRFRTSGSAGTAALSRSDSRSGRSDDRSTPAAPHSPEHTARCALSGSFRLLFTLAFAPLLDRELACPLGIRLLLLGRH